MCARGRHDLLLRPADRARRHRQRPRQLPAGVPGDADDRRSELPRRELQPPLETGRVRELPHAAPPLRRGHHRRLRRDRQGQERQALAERLRRRLQEGGDRHEGAAGQTSTRVVHDPEQNLEIDLQIPIRPRYKVTLAGRVEKKPGFRHYTLPAARTSSARGGSWSSPSTHARSPAASRSTGRSGNSGDEAIAAYQLRGQIVPGGATHRERTLTRAATTSRSTSSRTASASRSTGSASSSRRRAGVLAQAEEAGLIGDALEIASARAVGPSQSTVLRGQEIKGATGPQNAGAVHVTACTPPAGRPSTGARARTSQLAPGGLTREGA